MSLDTSPIAEPCPTLALPVRTQTVGVIGLGYVGLPLAHTFVSAGFRTLGFDIDQNKVDMLTRGQSYLEHVDGTWLPQAVEDERFAATSDFSQLREADCILICVPTPLTESREPDLSFVMETSKSIAHHLRSGQLIVLESTTYPGTTRDVVRPILEQGGKCAGRDFFLAYSPEREDPGNKQYTTRQIPKVVGGFDEASLQRAVALYESAFNSVIAVSSCEVAEACKILENTYRAVNIAMVNELKVLFHKMGLDIWEVIEAAKTKPFGFQAFYPGPGLGGHCIPIDPFYLTWLARRYESQTRFIELAGEVNTAMPLYVFERITAALNDHEKSVKGSSICVLGLAYKKDVNDIRESPGLRLIDLLLDAGANVTFSDPHVPVLPKTRRYTFPPLESSPLTEPFLASCDCVVIATDHTCFDYDAIKQHARLIVDTRNAMQAAVHGAAAVYKA